MKSTIYIFVRHAESEKNIRDVTGGKGEKLTKKGMEQATVLSSFLFDKIKGKELDIISSDTMQTKQTAKIVADMFHENYLVTEKLDPAGMGVISGLTKREMKEKYPDLYEQMALWREQKIEAIQLEIPEMEIPIVFWDRIVNYLKEINDGKMKILVCTRSIMVLVYNLVKGNKPILGHGYKHIKIENCDTVAFSVDANFEKIQLICEMTSEGLQ